MFRAARENAGAVVRYRVRGSSGHKGVKAMKESQLTGRGDGWLEGSGLLHIFRTLSLAVHPAKLGLALAAIFLTFVLGGVMDWIWTRGGGVDKTAIVQFISARELNQPYAEPTGTLGLFHVFREHEQRCVVGFLGSSLPGTSVGVGTPVGSYLEPHSNTGPLQNLVAMGYGVWWLLRCHPFFFILFAGGALVIWGLAGGAICRIAAVQYARDEKLTIKQALAFAKEKLFGGFVLAPCIPVAFILITAVCLVVGGMLLRVPFLGDLLAGPAFILAIGGGFVIAVLLLGLIVGGSLFWPSVAVEGSDAFDSFSRSLSYPLSKPWKAVLYAVMATVFAGLCWIFVNLFTVFTLTVTRGIVGFGTSPFGWWNRGEGEASVRKLDLLWPIAGPNALYSWPDWSLLTWYEHFSAFFIGVYVLIVIGLMWAFLASFYFSASTVIYFLLRRDVDGTDLEELHMEEEGSGKDSSKPESSPPPESTDVSLPISNAT